MSAVKPGRQAVRLGWASEAKARRLLEMAGWTVVPTAMSEPRGDLVAHREAPCRLTAARDMNGHRLVMLVEVKSRSWGKLPSPERAGCADARERAYDEGVLYRVACPRPKRDGGVWALHEVAWVRTPDGGRQARQTSWAALPVEGPPGTAPAKPGHLGGAPERVEESVDAPEGTESQGGT